MYSFLAQVEKARAGMEEAAHEATHEAEERMLLQVGLQGLLSGAAGGQAPASARPVPATKLGARI